MTIVSTIAICLTTVLAFLLGRCAYISNRLRRKVQDIKHKNQALFDDREILKSSLDKLCSVMTHEDVTYYASPCTSGSRWVVLRRCFVNGAEYHTFIKGFDDEDAEFNRREADELCEILNSK